MNNDNELWERFVNTHNIITPIEVLKNHEPCRYCLVKRRWFRKWKYQQNKLTTLQGTVTL